MEINGLLGLIWLIVVIWAVINVAQSPIETLPKVVWILLLLFLPLLGLILWLLLGPRKR